MVKGPFDRYRHEHRFVLIQSGTLTIDLVDFGTPLGVAGKMVDALLLRAHLRRLLESRNAEIKRRAEAAAPEGAELEDK